MKCKWKAWLDLFLMALSLAVVILITYEISIVCEIVTDSNSLGMMKNCQFAQNWTTAFGLANVYMFFFLVIMYLVDACTDNKKPTTTCFIKIIKLVIVVVHLTIYTATFGFFAHLWSKYRYFTQNLMIQAGCVIALIILTFFPIMCSTMPSAPAHPPTPPPTPDSTPNLMVNCPHDAKIEAIKNEMDRKFRRLREELTDMVLERTILWLEYDVQESVV